MGLFDKIVGGLPENSLLRLQKTELEKKNAALETEIAILKDEKRDAGSKIKKLEKRIEELTHIELHETLLKTLSLLQSFNANLPKRELRTADIIEYHSLLDEAARDLVCNLDEFRIPATAIQSREIPTSVSFDAFGNPSTRSIPMEQYCRIEPFKRKIDGLIAFLAKKNDIDLTRRDLSSLL
jgi:hypothetical protein